MVISSEIILATIIALPFVGSCLAVLFRTNMRTAEAFLAGFVAIAALALLIVTYPRVVDGGIVQYKAEWFPELGLEFYLRMDGFAWVMASLVTGIGVPRGPVRPILPVIRRTPCLASTPCCSHSWARCLASCCRAI